MTEKKKKDTEFIIQIVIVAVLALLVVYNVGKMTSGGSTSGGSSGIIQAVSASGIMPKGTPAIYGKELNVNYDDVSAADPKKADITIKVLGNLDNVITLQGADLDRYIDTVSQISCEYCCGAASIIVTKEDVDALNQKIEAAIKAGQITEEQGKKYRQNAGAAACGCAHSYAMRGLAKYLIKEHGSEFTNEQVLEELAKWKTLFFPGPMAAKAEVLKQKGIEFSYANLGSNRYRGIEQGQASGGAMVGGC